jgi:hypothetical protein
VVWDRMRMIATAMTMMVSHACCHCINTLTPTADDGERVSRSIVATGKTDTVQSVQHHVSGTGSNTIGDEDDVPSQPSGRGLVASSI